MKTISNRPFFVEFFFLARTALRKLRNSLVAGAKNEGKLVVLRFGNSTTASDVLRGVQ